MNIFIHEWAADVRKILNVSPYEDLPVQQDIIAGSYIFSDLDRLNDHQLAMAADFCSQRAMVMTLG